MPRRKIQFSKGNYYHIYNQGAWAHTLFIEEDNYQYVLRQCRRYCRQLTITVIAYVLMPNHYHLLLRQDGEVPVGELPARVFGGYSRAVNRRYGWKGTLFRGRFQAKLAHTETYLLHLCRYIHANPVRHGFVQRPEQWRHSNYQEWLGSRRDELVDLALVNHYFPEREDYIDFVWSYLRQQEVVPASWNRGDEFRQASSP